MSLNVKDKITRAKIRLQKDYPFWAYLSLFLKFKETEELPEYAGMGVDERGNLYYKNDFVKGLSDSELLAVITHEINHLVFLHLLRRNNRHPEIWNISADIVINSLLKLNKFQLPKGVLITDYDNKIKIFGKEIENCDKKITEEIYSELEKEVKKQIKKMGGKGGKGDKSKNGKGGKGKNGKGEGFGKLFEGRFDKHIESEKLSPKEKRELEPRDCTFGKFIDWINYIYLNNKHNKN